MSTPRVQSTPAESRSRVEAVYQTLLGMIRSGEVPRGAVLSELALARQLGVSRTPVHDALRQLARDGLVVQERARRARVAPFTPDDVYEIFELRKFLEGPAAELAAGRMDRRQLLPLRTAAAALEASARGRDWTRRWADFDALFHRTIAESSGNRRLCQEICRYQLLHHSLNMIATDVASLRQALAEHQAILTALEKRQPTVAHERMVAHITAWQEYFVRGFPHPLA